MASPDQIPDSEDDSDSMVLTHTPKKNDDMMEMSPPGSALSHRFREPSQSPTEQPRLRSSTSEEKRIAVILQGPSRPWEYQPYVEDNTVDTVLAKIDLPGGKISYRIEYEDGRRDDVSLDELLELRNGHNALEFYNHEADSQSSDSMADPRKGSSSAEPSASSSNVKRIRKKTQQPDFVNSKLNISSDEEEVAINKKRRLANGRVSLLSTNTNQQRSSRSLSRAIRDEDSESEADVPKNSGLRWSNRSSSRRARSANTSKVSRESFQNSYAEDEDNEADELAESGDSGIVYVKPKRKVQASKSRPGPKGTKTRSRRYVSDRDASSEDPEPTRKSGRERIIKSMREGDEDEEMYRDDGPVREAKVISIREIYQPVSKQSDFGRVHVSQCDICLGSGTASNKGPSPLVYCQGCSSSIHKVCLGYRSAREHRVTKVGHENFVMQCRRCLGLASKKDHSAPLLNVCQGCQKPGAACAEFSPKRTTKQEEKLRAENDGDDPITEVPAELINNAGHVMFRCDGCRRAWHLEHMPSLHDDSETPVDLQELRDARLEEYSQGQCKECTNSPGKVDGLVAWRPADVDSYTKGQTADAFREDQIEYLVKWAKKSYYSCTWMPGGWVWGVTVAIMRNAFFNRDDGANRLPRFTFEEAVQEDYLRMEIVFDVRYEGYCPKSEISDKLNVARVSKVLVKFEGLSYENSVWDKPPTPEDGKRWSDFVAAYNEFLAGKYFKAESRAVLKERIDNFQEQDFVELKSQPSALIGGEMMDYQREGMNWLLYNFHQQKNVILADEMGLGKTIQVIAFIAALVKHEPKCWPFLIVTPNSTCPNWRREIKKWAPDVRVVAYYGGAAAREMAMNHELFPNGVSAGPADMRAHVVVTSYEAPVQSPTFFRKIKWAGMIVDEGQRLKNDENLLYGALTRLKPPSKALLTGTPLQNNKRELFNLLQFCDPELDAEELDEKYQELNKDNLSELHDLIRPYFLRRTKLEVLKFLPPMAQVIVPVTMTSVQKKLYKSILSKNPDLIRSLFDTKNLKTLSRKDRGNLNNLLMQLRKCLCHPFMYSSAIEEKTLGEEELKRNLIDASSKFKLLEIMLPKLKERGHRVLIFSQFLEQLDLIEDFLGCLEVSFERLDGNVSAMEKQRRIDLFNAPGSKLFAFLLSTRAGGVGINLATADTVIIMDPDFNPHQDIQAFSRAHRIGQKHKVLVIQLMTKGSAEEKIAQSSRKKMALDQVLIESMNTEDDAGEDLESVLKHGAKALFEDDDTNDIHYDSASVDRLLDRTEIESTDVGKNKTEESRFSMARIWANDKGTLTEDVIGEEEAPMDVSWWDKKLEARAAEAAAEAAKNVVIFGRGKRSRAQVRYDADEDQTGESPQKQRGRKRRPAGDDSNSDNDFHGGAETDGEEDDQERGEQVDPHELEATPESGRSRGLVHHSQEGPFVRYPPILPPPRNYSTTSEEQLQLRRSKDLKTTYPSGNPSTLSQPHQATSYPTPSLHWHRPYASRGNIVSQSAQHVRGNGKGEGQPTAQRNAHEGSFSHRHGTEVIHTAGVVLQHEAGNTQNRHGHGQKSLKRCPECRLPHLDQSAICPHKASELQLRLLIDHVDHLPEAVAQANAQYKAILEAYLYKRCHAKRHGSKVPYAFQR